jgi:hypothetical protein
MTRRRFPSAPPRAARLRHFRSRRASRGVSPVSTVLEAAMVMGWFAILVLGERAVSSAADARRSAETAAEQSSTQSSAGYCTPSAVTIGTARAAASVTSSTKPNVSIAISLISALGGATGARTWQYYVKALVTVQVKSTATASPVPGDNDPSDRTFEADRRQGCLEKPLDLPKGTMDVYRHVFWIKNLMGY